LQLDVCRLACQRSGSCCSRAAAGTHALKTKQRWPDVSRRCQKFFRCVFLEVGGWKLEVGRWLLSAKLFLLAVFREKV
jgi:hypothetical protein